MIDKDTEICVCNSLSAGDIAKCIKKYNFQTIEELFDNNDCPIGDKCKSCKEEGINNDGMNAPLVFALVKQGRL